MMDFFLTTAIGFWLLVVIVAVVIELASVGLVSIWFAAGAVVAGVSASLGAPVWLQVILFLVVSLGMLVGLKPFVQSYIRPKQVKTNYEDLVGKKVRVLERVDNITATGRVFVNGMEWMARMQNDEETLEKDQQGEVLRVEGVKLILRPLSEAAIG